MSVQNLVKKLSELEESVRVNKIAIENIIAIEDFEEKEKIELIKQLTIPLTLSNNTIMTDIKNFYKAKEK